MTKNGATYVSPFVGRWVDNSVDGIGLIKDIKEYTIIMDASEPPMASVHHLEMLDKVEQSFLMSADVCTILLVFWKMYKNILTDKGLELFQADWDDVNKNREVSPFSDAYIKPFEKGVFQGFSRIKPYIKGGIKVVSLHKMKQRKITQRNIR